MYWATCSPPVIWQTNMLKSDSHLSKNVCFICFIESPLKMMKNASYFILRTVLVLKILNFCYESLVMLKKRLDLKNMVNFKIYDIKTLLANN